MSESMCALIEEFKFGLLQVLHSPSLHTGYSRDCSLSKDAGEWAGTPHYSRVSERLGIPLTQDRSIQRRQLTANEIAKGWQSSVNAVFNSHVSVLLEFPSDPTPSLIQITSNSTQSDSDNSHWLGRRLGCEIVVARKLVEYAFMVR